MKIIKNLNQFSYFILITLVILIATCNSVNIAISHERSYASVYNNKKAPLLSDNTDQQKMLITLIAHIAVEKSDISDNESDKNNSTEDSDSNSDHRNGESEDSNDWNRDDLVTLTNQKINLRRKFLFLSRLHIFVHSPLSDRPFAIFRPPISHIS